MLIDTATTIATRFPDYGNASFVQEKFHEDWSPDREWGWQQNRAVVGHNLKIAWNLMRMQALRPKDSYVNLARHIADIMPAAGSDRQRGGWYDVVERVKQPGQEWFRFAWHDRKAWWQQEQAILAYLILGGTLGDGEYVREAERAAGFYNTFFLDHDEGAVYFNVLANGLPYLLGTERLKGSHSMSMYHSAELCYLAAVYSNLLVTKQPLNLYFKPRHDADRTLRVAPDLLAPGRVRLARVEVDGKPYKAFDPQALTVELPESANSLNVEVQLVPTE
jgi:mannose/cellobiose epimerase-like protein (N-acyl-D-glucosamine 2-epimerase family)